MLKDKLNKKINKDKKWLVRSNWEFFGPFTQEEVETHLRNHFFSGYDEICLPTKRYSYIRLVPEFLKIIRENSKVSKGIGENTNTLDIEESAVTETHSISLAKENSEGGSNKNQNPIAPPSPLGSTQRVEVTPTPPPKSDLPKTKRLVVIIGGVVCLLLMLLAAAFIGKRYFLNTKPSISIERLKQKGLEAYDVGDYKQAKKLLSQVDLEKPNLPEVLLRLSALRMDTKDEQAQTQKTLESLAGTKQDPVFSAQVQTLLALFYMKKGYWKKAESFLEKAEKLDPSLLSIFLNRAMMALNRSLWKELETNAQTAINLGDTTGLSEFVLGWGYLKQYLKTKKNKKADKSFLVKAEQKLLSVSSRPNRYRSFAYLLLIHIGTLKNSGGADLFFAGFLNSLGDKTENYYRDILVFNSSIGWRELNFECLSAAQGLAKESWQRAFHALCLTLIKRKGDRGVFLEEAKLLDPQDNFVKVIWTFFLKQKGDDEKALLSVKEVQKQKKYALPFLIEAQICFKKKDHACAQKAWQRSLELDRESLPAHMGLLMLDRDNKEMSGQITNIYPKYLPLYRHLREHE